MNGPTHKAVTGISMVVFLAMQERREDKATAMPLAGGAAGAFFACLPDLLEPAIHPNHRQFFHSLAFASLLVAGFVKLKEYKPKSSEGELLRLLGLVAIPAYLIHLAMDAATAKSLPMIGRL